MRNSLDFSSWQSLLSTVLGLLFATLLMLGIRLVFMQTMQRKRERENRQINERLKTLIAAYKTLGSSFTGELSVDPSHLKELRSSSEADEAPIQDWEAFKAQTERRRRMRDAVEAALSDIILLGTEAQVALAARAAQDMVAGRAVRTSELVVSLRNFIRQALDLEAIAESTHIPEQGPQRIAAGGGSGKRNSGNGGGAGGGRGAGSSGGGGGAGMGAGGLAVGAGAGVHAANTSSSDGAQAPAAPLAAEADPLAWVDNPR
ncbi:hypothetical protein [Comamonas odontotermitis]|uniref:hypothetical protein n=1 Tax=Comamonas odontotermitis TaxID=379895 RepID=UPI0037526A65